MFTLLFKGNKRWCVATHATDVLVQWAERCRLSQFKKSSDQSYFYCWCDVGLWLFFLQKYIKRSAQFLLSRRMSWKLNLCRGWIAFVWHHILSTFACERLLNTFSMKLHGQWTQVPQETRWVFCDIYIYNILIDWYLHCYVLQMTPWIAGQKSQNSTTIHWTWNSKLVELTLSQRNDIWNWSLKLLMGHFSSCLFEASLSTKAPHLPTLGILSLQQLCFGRISGVISRTKSHNCQNTTNEWSVLVVSSTSFLSLECVFCLL